MNNEEKILSMLEHLTTGVSGLRADVTELKSDVAPPPAGWGNAGKYIFDGRYQYGEKYYLLRHRPYVR